METKHGALFLGVALALAGAGCIPQQTRQRAATVAPAHEPTQSRTDDDPPAFNSFRASDVAGAERSYGRLSFSYPAELDVEYVAAIDALNMYVASGEGTPRQRSQVFIRHFEAKRFLTLTAVDVRSTENLAVGVDSLDARRYVIRKKSGVPDFPEQPAWRNDEHTVTDFRAAPGIYYVVAANPALDAAAYERILATMRFSADAR